MDLDPDEVQIVKGPDLVVTDKRIVCKDGEFATSAISAPLLEERVVPGSARMTVMSVGAALLFGGLLVQIPPVWIIGALTCAFAPFANVKRRALVLTIETGDGRQTIYMAPNQNDAKLALAAVEEALRRSAA